MMTGRAPITPALPTQDTLSESLTETDCILDAAHQFLRLGNVVESIEYLRRSQVNVIALVRLLRKQKDIEKLAQGFGIALPVLPNNVVLKKPPAKRRKKSENSDIVSADRKDNDIVNNVTNSTAVYDAPTANENSSNALDMPSLL
jgi:hypothetical protein